MVSCSAFFHLKLGGRPVALFLEGRLIVDLDTTVEIGVSDFNRASGFPLFEADGLEGVLGGRFSMLSPFFLLLLEEALELRLWLDELDRLFEADVLLLWFECVEDESLSSLSLDLRLRE